MALYEVKREDIKAKGTGCRKWSALFGAWLAMLARAGIYCNAIYIGAIEEEFGTSKDKAVFLVSLETTVYLISCGFASSIIVHLGGAQYSMFFGTCMVAGGAICMSFIDGSETMIGVCFGVMGIGEALSYMSGMSIQYEWFEDKPGFACGITLSGIGVGALAFSQYIKHLEPNTRLRGLLRYAALWVAVLGSVSALLIRKPPAVAMYRHAHTQLSDSIVILDEPDEGLAPPAQAPPPNSLSALRRNSVYFLLISQLFYGFFYYGTLMSLIPLLKARFPAEATEATTFLQIYFVADTAMRIPAGFLCDRVGAFNLIIISSIGGGLGCVALAFLHDWWWAIVIPIGVWGASGSTTMVSLSTLASQVVGCEHASFLLGIAYAGFWMPGALFSATLMTAASDIDPTYCGGMWGLAGVTLCATCFLLISHHQYRCEQLERDMFMFTLPPTSAGGLSLHERRGACIVSGISSSTSTVTVHDASVVDIPSSCHDQALASPDILVHQQIIKV